MQNKDNKVGLSCAKLSKLGARYQLAGADNSAIVAGARSLAELRYSSEFIGIKGWFGG